MKNFTFDPILVQPIPDRVQKILIDALPPAFVGITEVSINEVTTAIINFNHEGPFHMAKRLDLLTNNSGEDMAIEFMTFANKMFPNTY